MANYNLFQLTQVRHLMLAREENNPPLLEMMRDRERGLQACGYFYVNKQIIPVLICNLATYFIVLAQFRLSEINQ